jgi:hypothetical protein
LTADKTTNGTTDGLKDVTEYIEERYGSVIAFLLLKYLLEHKLAREKDGFTNYEIAFRIAPSIVLTPTTLIKIETRADGTTIEEAEDALRLLLEKRMVHVDKETQILSVNVPIESIANVYLKKIGHYLKQVNSFEEADVILLNTIVGEYAEKGVENPANLYISGVPDILLKNEKGELIIVGLKFGTPKSD